MATDRVATIVLACLEIWRLVLVARLMQVRRRLSIPDQPTAPRHDAQRQVLASGPRIRFQWKPLE